VSDIDNYPRITRKTTGGNRQQREKGRMRKKEKRVRDRV